MKQTVAQNTISLTSAFVAQRFFSFIFFTLIARFVGVENTGAYVFAISYTTIFSIFADLGLSSVLIREIARKKEDSGRLLRAVLAAKLMLLIVTVALVILILPFLNKPPLINAMVYVATGLMVFDSFNLTFWAVFRGWQNLKYEGINVVIGQILIVAVGVVVIFSRLPLPFLIAAILVGSLYQLLSSGFLITRKLNLSLWPKFDKPTMVNLFKMSFPFALSGVFTRFYSYLDQILLSLLAGELALGWYSVPYKITFALQFIPQAFGAALFPAMSDYFINSKEKLARLFERSMFYLMNFSIPASVGIAVLAEPIILRIYGQAYQPSILALQIMMVSLVFVFLSFPVGALLNSGNKQTQQTVNLALTLVTNAGLNAILIPRYGYLGASAAIVVSMAVLFFSGLYWTRKITDYRAGYLLSSFTKSLASAAIMGFIISYMKDLLMLGPKSDLVYKLLILPLTGVAIYLAAMFLIGGIKKQDFLDLISAFRRKV